ncbi:MAG: beta-propeller fold lactonase family protein [Sandaracinaceae bacterium]|nr:beta-propeller fold lactonase family protein [Sandaracinaceae bacterium]
MNTLASTCLGSTIAIVVAGCGGGTSTMDGGADGAVDGAVDAGGAGPATFLYVANYEGDTISGFEVGEDGALTEVSGSPFAAPSRGFTLALAAPDRIYMPTGNGAGATNQILSFTIDWSTGALVAGTPLATTRADGSYGIAATPSGAFLYVNQPDAAGTVAGYAVGTSGALTPLAGSPFAADGDLAQLAMAPSGELLYVAGAQRNRVFGMRIGASGALTPVPQGSVTTGPGAADYAENPQHLAVHPGGRFLYVGNFASGNVAAFAIDPNTGDLTEMAGSPFAAATGVCALAFDRQGQFLYAGIGGQPAASPSVCTPSASTGRAAR